MKKICLINGAPNSGKDTIANYFVNKYPDRVAHVRFKDKLYDICASISNINLDDFIDIANDRDKKDSVIIFRGLTPRQMLIDVSENLIKPRYGSSYFAHYVTEFINKTDRDIVIISDGGFVDEVNHVVRNAVYDEFYVLRLYRQGCSFTGDSRIRLERNDFDKKVNILDIHNDSTEQDLFNKVENILMTDIASLTDKFNEISNNIINNAEIKINVTILKILDEWGVDNDSVTLMYSTYVPLSIKKRYIINNDKTGQCKEIFVDTMSGEVTVNDIE